MEKDSCVAEMLRVIINRDDSSSTWTRFQGLDSRGQRGVPGEGCHCRACCIYPMIIDPTPNSADGR
jgi:hypothetical protein